MAINGLGVVSGAFATQTYANNAGGLQLVTPTSIANSGGSASASGGAVTFTGVNSVSLNGCFTSTYDSYKIVYRWTDNNNDVIMRLRVSGTDATTNYTQQVITAEASSIGTSRSTPGYITVGLNTAGGNSETLVTNPAVASSTAVLTQVGSAYGGALWRAVSGIHSTATAYDGFTLLPPSGTISGVVRVYGLKN